MSRSAVPGLTESTARAQIYDDLKRALDGLPAGASWGLTSDSAPQTLDGAIVAVCSDSDGATPADTPVNVEIGYWLNGAKGHGTAYFQTLQRVMRAHGWSEVWSRTGKVAYQRDGYGLSVILAGDGSDIVSVNVTSPCFWQRDKDAVNPALQTAQPRVIDKSYSPAKQ